MWSHLIDIHTKYTDTQIWQKLFIKRDICLQSFTTCILWNWYIFYNLCLFCCCCQKGPFSHTHECLEWLYRCFTRGFSVSTRCPKIHHWIHHGFNHEELSQERLLCSSTNYSCVWFEQKYCIFITVCYHIVVQHFPVYDFYFTFFKFSLLCLWLSLMFLIWLRTLYGLLALNGFDRKTSLLSFNGGTFFCKFLTKESEKYPRPFWLQETKRPSKEMQVSIARQLGLQPTTVGNFFMNARRRLQDKWDGEPPQSPTPPSPNEHQQQQQQHTVMIQHQPDPGQQQHLELEQVTVEEFVLTAEQQQDQLSNQIEAVMVQSDNLQPEQQQQQPQQQHYSLTSLWSF